MTGWSATHAGVKIVVTGRDDETLVVRAEVEGCGDVTYERLLAALRHATSQAELEAHAVEGPFRVEDVLTLTAEVGAGEAAVAERWLRRRLARDTAVVVRSGASASVEAVFARRGTRATSQRQVYTRTDGKVRVEAFELHVVEHCNLRCTSCCNMSPYMPEKTLAVAEVERMCRTMAGHIEADVFKIMGGEPLLHPDITGVVRAIRGTGISRVVRLFTNGLLLHKMGEEFWEALDELTISNYTSAPVKPAMVAEIQEKARAHDVVLNIKPVGAFSEVMSDTRVDTDEGMRRVYDNCWLRHRCMVVRNEKFYMCTRAAYADDFHTRLLRGAHPDDHSLALADGVPISTPDLGAALLEYLNRERPLASCRFCHGGAGPLAPHSQLSKADVREGRLRPLRVLGS